MKRRLWDVPLWKQGRKVILAFGLALTMFASACGTSSSETTSEAAQSSAAAAETTAAETTAAAAVEETTTAAASSGLEESVKLLNDYDNPAVYTSRRTRSFIMDCTVRRFRSMMWIVNWWCIFRSMRGRTNTL